MFEATLYTADLDRQRLQRLTLAAAIALAATTTALASVWTLDRLQVDRIHGPAQQLELAQLSLLPPLKLIEPPPPPPVIESGGGLNAVTATIDRDEDKLIDIDHGSDLSTPPSNTGASKGGGIPGPGVVGCPTGICGGALDGIGKPCVGPQCVIGDPFPKVDDAPPKQVEFSALRCLACADPDRTALRKTMASAQGREGNVVARFCVDTRGRVESKSIVLTQSYGDAAVDRIVRAAIEKWRFSPMKVGNQPRRACSSTKFKIRFD